VDNNLLVERAHQNFLYRFPLVSMQSRPRFVCEHCLKYSYNNELLIGKKLSYTIPWYYSGTALGLYGLLNDVSDKRLRSVRSQKGLTGICLEVLKKFTKNFSWDSRHLGRDSNKGLPDYKSKTLSL
jgi:hypothetical protein